MTAPKNYKVHNAGRTKTMGTGSKNLSAIDIPRI